MSTVYTNLGNFLTACANSIRSVEGSSANIVANDIPDRIAALSGGGGSIIPSDLPSDGKTRIEYTIPENASAGGKKITLSFYHNTASTGTTVDWGDGSATTSSSGSGRKTLTHTYSTTGDKIVAITVSTGSIYFGGSTTNTIYGSTNATAATNLLRSYIQWAVIGAGVSKLAQYAFYYCVGLKEIRLPSTGLTEIANSAFANCYMLQTLKIPDAVTSIGSQVASSCYSLKTVVLPSNTSFVSLPSNGFSGCQMLESITIPNQITSFASSVFNNCSQLKTINIPTKVTEIQSSAFAYNFSLTELNIPSTVTSLGSKAFNYMYGLQKLRFNSATPPTASSDTFSGVLTSCIISVPTGKLSAYTGAQNYPSSSTYTYIEE